MTFGVSLEKAVQKIIENGSLSSALSLVNELDSDSELEGSVADEHSILCSKLANVIIKYNHARSFD